MKEKRMLENVLGPKSGILMSGILLGAALGWGCTSTVPANAATLKVEAEAKPAAGDMKIIEDKAASGGKAVSISREWQPLIWMDLPAGDEFTVWMRHKGGPLQLKGTPGGAQKDLQWIWDAPSEWKWSRVGRWKRAELGDRILVIRGGKSDNEPQLDAVYVSTNDSDDPAKSDAKVANTTSDKKTDENAPSSTQKGAYDISKDDKAPQDKAFKKGTRVEAESVAAAGVVDDASASGGKAVTGTGDWQLLVNAPLSDEVKGDAFQVWIRRKHGPLAMKVNANGQRTDRWNWDNPGEWTWTDMGTFSRAEFGGSILIGRGQKSDAPAPQIDAVVFAPAKLKILPTNKPDDKAAPLAVKASVNWNKTAAKVPAMLWGANDYEILYPERAADKEYQKLLKQLDLPIIRIHNGGMAHEWTDASTQKWNVEKIKAGFKGSTGFGDAKILMNVAHWPEWLSKDKTLSPADEDRFAKLCGELVRVMRDEVKVPIAYWEMTNEYDNTYENAGKLDDLWRLFNKIAKEVKRVEPKAKVGGPALTWPKGIWLEGFLKNCGQNIDFFTWHNYASGDLYDSNEHVLSRTETIANMARDAVNAAKKYVPNKKLEMFLTEYNIKWVWDPVELRHGNNIGAVFHASTLRQLVDVGVSGAMVWHLKGHSYGIIEGDNTPRAPFNLFRWGTHYLTGNMPENTSSDAKSLRLFPVVRADGSRSLLLINSADRRVQIAGGNALFPSQGKTIRAERIDSDGFKTLDAKSFMSGTWTLPGYSVTLLTTAK
jgi:hypothetical protein